MFILYKHYHELGDTGLLGVVIIMILYLVIIVINVFIFYNYLVFMHMEGRIIDIYTRVTATSNCFFIPLDNEISSRYLAWVLTKVKMANTKYAAQGDVVGTKRFALTYNTIKEKSRDYSEKSLHISIFRENNEGRLVLYRHFIKNNDGTICELEEGISFTVDDHPLLETWPEIKRKPNHSPIEAQDNKIGAFNLLMDKSDADKNAGSPSRRKKIH